MLRGISFIRSYLLIVHDAMPILSDVALEFKNVSTLIFLALDTEKG